MFAFVRKNLASLVTKHTSSVRKSDVLYSLSLQFFSTRRGGRASAADKVYDVLVHKHQFSPEVASLAASHLTQIRSPMKADLILAFLEDCGFSSNQLEKIVKYKPRILWNSVEDIKFKIKILQDLGLSSEDVKKIIYNNMVILHLSAKNNIIPTLSLLRGLLGSDFEVARLLRRSGRVILFDLEKTLLPNFEFLKSCGILVERILWLLHRYPYCLLNKPDTIRQSVEKAKEIGFRESSNMFIYALRIIVPMSKGMWEVKLQAFRDVGFSDSDTLSMFKKAPQVFGLSMKKIVAVKELLLATGKFNISSIVANPHFFCASIEKRLKPRLIILGILESKNMIIKWPGVSLLYTLPDDKFFERYVRPYLGEVGETLDRFSYFKSKGKEG